MPELKIERVSEGLGFGEGTISAIAQESKPGNEDLARQVDEAIQSPRILAPVSRDGNGHQLQDDGCGDGRNAGVIFNKYRQFSRSLNRAKVFGGGAIMSLASRIGLGKTHGTSLQESIVDATGDLSERGMDFGAHTASHAHGPKCGCGAIDEAVAIIGAAGMFKEKITGTIAGLGVDTEGLDDVIDAFSEYADEIKDQPYSGREVMNEIVDQGKIVKELTDEHLETRIVLNMVDDYTVDQEYVRNTTGGRAQVFAVDVWRMRRIAECLHDGPADMHKAFLSELVYTLATAGVLTKGDLPVYLVAEAEQYASVA